MYVLARGFSWQHRITEFASNGYASPLRINARRICLSDSLPAYPSTTTDWYGYLPASPHRLTTTNEGPAQPHHPIDPKVAGESGFGRLVPLIHHGRTYTGTGISTRCPSTTPVGLALGPDSPWEDWPGPGTLGLSAGKVLTCLFATHACILTPTPSTARSLCCFTGCRTLPYPTRTSLVAAASAVYLSPATLSAHNHLTSELLRTLSRVAASKPTSWLSSRLHILFHLVHA